MVLPMRTPSLLLFLPLALMSVGCGCYQSIQLTEILGQAGQDGTVEAAFTVSNDGLCFDWPAEDTYCVSVTWFEEYDESDTAAPDGYPDTAPSLSMTYEGYRPGFDTLLDQQTACFNEFIPEGGQVLHELASGAALEGTEGLMIQGNLHMEDAGPDQASFDWDLHYAGPVSYP